MTISQSTTIRRLTILGLTKADSIALCNEIDLWINCSGPQWTIDRLKSIKVGFIQHIAGKSTKLSWISTRNGIPKGPISRIFSLKKPHRVLNTLMIYSELISPRLTDKQWKKFHNSFVKQPKHVPTFWGAWIGESYEDSFGGSVINFTGPTLKVEIPVLNSDRFIAHFGKNGGTRSPDFSSKDMKTSVINPKLTASSFDHYLARSFVNKNYGGNFPSWFDLSVISRFSRINNVMNSLHHGDHVGRISFIQEPGFKLRAVANPLPCFQVLLEPLKASLMTCLQRIPEDFTHNQDHGVEYIQNLINDGTYLSSVDLSDASNHIPLKNQMEFLRLLFAQSEPLLELFEKVSKAEWYVDGPDGPQTIKCGTGQPLGLGPSFASFSLFHHLMVRSVMSAYDNSPKPIEDLFNSILTGKSEYSYPYAIVGDDVVIDSKYTLGYLNLLKYYDIPISESKCIFDAPVAEFCSRVITKTKVHRMYKWTVVSDKNFLDLAKTLGPKSLSLFRPLQRKILRNIGEIPDTLGGPVGWNLNNTCLLEREAKYWKLAELLISDDKELSTRRSELYYRLRRDLGLLTFVRPNPHNFDTIRGEVDPRQRILDEVLFQYNYGASPRVAFATTLSLFPKECEIRLTQREREDMDWIISHPDATRISWKDARIERLCSLFGISTQ